jgi:hypothetical protein
MVGFSGAELAERPPANRGVRPAWELDTKNQRRRAKDKKKREGIPRHRL